MPGMSAMPSANGIYDEGVARKPWGESSEGDARATKISPFAW